MVALLLLAVSLVPQHCFVTVLPPARAVPAGRAQTVALFAVLSSLTKHLVGGLVSKESACNAGDLGSIPGSGRSSEEGNGYSLQYSCLGNSMDCIVHGVTKSWTQLGD